jgi:chromosome segregation ATPase
MKSRIEDSNLLKHYICELKKFEEERENLKNNIGVIQKQLNKINSEIDNLNNKITKLKDKNKDLIVSEHAILRYLERVENFNLDEIINKICIDDLKKMYQTLGNGTFPIKDSNFSVKIKNGVILTVLK